MTMPKITIGCDPELFVQRKSDGMFVSAHDLIPGTKDEPYKVPGGAIQVDGLAVEFNTDPASTVEEWNENINKVRANLEARLPDYNLVVQPTCTFDQTYFDSLPDEVKVLGCDPDFNAYTGKPNPRPDGNPPFRTAAGHVHFGWTKDKALDDIDHTADCIEVVKQMDFYLGVSSLCWDKDMKRRQMYGAAGCFRIKPYGVEYRTPSNMWLTHPDYQSFVFRAGMAGITDLHDGQAQRVYCGNEWSKNLISKARMDRDILGVLARSGNLLEAGLRHVFDLSVKKAKAPSPLAGFKADYFIHDEIGGLQNMAAAPPPPVWGRARPQEDMPEFRWRGEPIHALPDHELVRALDFMANELAGPHRDRAIGQLNDEFARRHGANGAQAVRG